MRAQELDTCAKTVQRNATIPDRALMAASVTLQRGNVSSHQWQRRAVGFVNPTARQARSASLSSNPRSNGTRSPLKSPSLSVSPCMARTKNCRKSLRSSHHASSFTP